MFGLYALISMSAKHLKIYGAILLVLCIFFFVAIVINVMDSGSTVHPPPLLPSPLSSPVPPPPVRTRTMCYARRTLGRRLQVVGFVDDNCDDVVMAMANDTWSYWFECTK